MRTWYPRRPVPFLLIPLLAIGFSGCQRGHYDLEQSVDGATLQRELRYKVAGGGDESSSPVEAEEARILAAAYDVPVPVPLPAELVMSGEFQGSTPGDIGGAGSLEHWQTPLGSAWMYVERIRGNDAPQMTLAARQAATEEVVDMIRDWFRVELNTSDDRERVVRFLDTEFRDDLRNIITMVWTASAANAVEPAGAQERNQEFVVRIGQYLVERGYLTYRDLPRLALLNDEREQFEFTRSLLARRLNIDLTRPDWEFLSNRNVVEGSLNAAIGSRRLPQPDGNEVPVPASTWASERVMRALGGPLDSGDGLAARLRLPRAPFHTNGQWQADEQCVFWERGLPLREADSTPALPTVLYAQWSGPDAAFQTAHFGRVVLTDEALWEYCDWSSGLSDEQRREWEAFVETLQPGPRLVQEIQGFTFWASSDNSRTVAAPPTVLIDALNSR